MHDTRLHISENLSRTRVMYRDTPRQNMLSTNASNLFVIGCKMDFARKDKLKHHIEKGHGLFGDR